MWRLLKAVGLLLVPCSGVDVSCSDGAAGAGVYLDGKDDVLWGFPTFALGADWTVEAWVQPDPGGLAAAEQCLLHLSTVLSAENLLTLSLVEEKWVLRYGAASSVTTGPTAVSSSPHHVALTHSVTGASQAELRLYVNGTLELSATATVASATEPTAPFHVGACQRPTVDGVLRDSHFQGHLDELRHWATARSASEVQAGLSLAGAATGWPSAALGAAAAALEAQYGFDLASAGAETAAAAAAAAVGGAVLVDSSGNGNHGALGQQGVGAEVPAPVASAFEGLLLSAAPGGASRWARHLEVKAVDLADSGCPSSHCFSFSPLAACDDGVTYAGLLLRRVPLNQAKGVFLAAATDLGRTALTVGSLFSLTDALLLIAQEPVPLDSFEVQLCESPGASTADCADGPVYTVSFRVLENRRPTAGGACGLHLLGEAGFAELPEPLPPSGSLEFWMWMPSADEQQTIFSLTESGTGREILNIGVTGSGVNVYMCSATAPLDVLVPHLFSSDPQHLALSWERLGTANSTTSYRVSFYRDCTALISAAVVADACVDFELDASRLLLPTFGQHYGIDVLGRIASTGFANMHIDDIRMWDRPLLEQEICEQMYISLVGDESNLMTHLKVSATDVSCDDAELFDTVAGGQSTGSRCAYVRVPCPDVPAGLGFGFRPSAFELPPSTVEFETTASITELLMVSLSHFDRDNYYVADKFTDGEARDAVSVRVTDLPDASCGTLLQADQSTPVALSDVLDESQLPCYFRPHANAVECSSIATYEAIDSNSRVSMHPAVVKLSVRPPGPEVASLHLFGSADLAATGVILEIRFDQPTDEGRSGTFEGAAASWSDLLELIDGSLAGVSFTTMWSGQTDVLLLKLLSGLSDLQLIPGQTKLRCRAFQGLPLRSYSGGSYPCVGDSPTLAGSSTTPPCDLTSGQAYDQSTATCKDCGVGFFRSDDAFACVSCPVGTFAALTSMTECHLCEPGTFANSTGMSTCLQAAPGYYAQAQGSTRQWECPIGTVAEVAGNPTCAACVEGADCETTENFHTLASPLEEYFRGGSGEILRCGLFPKACRGWDASGGLNRCAAGLAGLLCRRCDAGWWRPPDRQRSRCERCPSDPSFGPVVLLLLVMYVVCWLLGVMSLDAALWGNMHAVMVRLLLNYFTAVSVLSRIEDWELQAAVGSEYADIVAAVLHVLFRFNGGLPEHWLGLECYYKNASGDEWTMMRARTLFWLIGPLACLCVYALISVVLFHFFAIYWWLRQRVKKEPVLRETARHILSEGREELAEEPRFLLLWRTAAVRCHPCQRLWVVLKDTQPLLVVCYFMMLPAVLQGLVPVLTCDKIGESGGQWRLRTAPEVQCLSRDEHLTWFTMAIAGVVTYGILVPALMCFFLYTMVATGHRGGHIVVPPLAHDMQLRSRLSFIIDGYGGRFVHWEAVVWLRQCLILLVACVPDTTRASELFLYQVIVVGAVVLHHAATPFDHRMGMILDDVEQAGLFCFLALLTTLQIVLSADAEGAYALFPVLMVGGLLAASSVGHSSSSGELLQRLGLAGLFAALLLAAWLGQQGRQHLLAFILVLMAVALNCLFLLWVLVLLMKQVKQALGDAFERSLHGAEGATAQLLAGRDAASTLAQRVHNWVLSAELAVIKSAHDSMGARIKFDPESEELVLGLHPETFAHDPNYSAYSKRQLFKLAPFLSDQERSYVAMGLRDALTHVIVECDTNMVQENLLEFLIRITFAWSFEEHIRGLDESVESDSSQTPVHDLAFDDLLFDGRVYATGITAYDFQRHLLQVTKLSKEEIQKMLTDFQQARNRQPPPPDPSTEEPAPPELENTLAVREITADMVVELRTSRRVSRVEDMLGLPPGPISSRPSRRTSRVEDALALASGTSRPFSVSSSRRHSRVEEGTSGLGDLGVAHTASVRSLTRPTTSGGPDAEDAVMVKLKSVHEEAEEEEEDKAEKDEAEEAGRPPVVPLKSVREEQEEEEEDIVAAQSRSSRQEQAELEEKPVAGPLKIKSALEENTEEDGEERPGEVAQT